MNIHPLSKTFFSILSLSILLFLLFKMGGIGVDNFRWINRLDGTSNFDLLVYLVFNFSLVALISLSFSLPYYFLTNPKLSLFLKWTITLSIFLWLTFLFNVNIRKFPQSFISILEEIFETRIQYLIFLSIFPLGFFLITKIFIDVKVKLLLFLLASFPLILLFSETHFFRIFRFFPSSIDYEVFFSFIFVLSLISYSYFKKFEQVKKVKIEEEILDAPDL